MRIPEPRRPFHQLRSVRPTAIQIPPFAPAGKFFSVRPDDGVIRSQVFTESKIHPAHRVERNSREAVVRIIALRFEFDNLLPPVGLQVAVVVVKQEDVAASGNEKAEGRESRAEGFFLCLPLALSPWPLAYLQPQRFHDHAHRVCEAVGEHGRLVGFAVAVGVFENQDTVGLVARVTLRPEVRVAFDGEHTALVIDVNSGGRDDRRMLGEQFDLQIGIERTRLRLIRGIGAGRKKKKTDGE